MPTNAQEKVNAYAEAEFCECDWGGSHRTTRAEALPAAIDALRKVLFMANVIRNGGPIDGATVAHEIDRLIISALEEK